MCRDSSLWTEKWVSDKKKNLGAFVNVWALSVCYLFRFLHCRPFSCCPRGQRLGRARADFVPGREGGAGSCPLRSHDSESRLLGRA